MKAASASPQERRYCETEEYVAFIRRVLAALGRRVGEADIAMLSELAELPTMIESELTRTVTRLRAVHGYSWADIGDALGVSRQAAQQRFGRQLGVDSQPPSGIGAARGTSAR